MKSVSIAALAALLISSSTVAAQGPAVGDAAPAFTLPVASREGVAAQPLSLETLKGQVVVLAFFPRARTGGCTAQMRAYRDQYEELFGKDVALLAISTDTPEDLASWAKDENFPFRFVADVGGEVAKRYEVLPDGRSFASRVLFVIGADGKVATVMRPFREIDPTAYVELREAIVAARDATR
jgi:peroxiredoxin Q/BCP